MQALDVLLGTLLERHSACILVCPHGQHVIMQDCPHPDYLLAVTPGSNVMRTLVVASRKGGAGKTTISGHIAVEAERCGARAGRDR